MVVGAARAAQGILKRHSEQDLLRLCRLRARIRELAVFSFDPNRLNSDRQAHMECATPLRRSNPVHHPSDPITFSYRAGAWEILASREGTLLL